VTARFGFPINLAVRDRRCVVVGGGEEAALRVRRLRDAGADLVVVTPAVSAALRGLLDDTVELRERAWCPSDLDGASLVIGTHEDPLDAPRFHREGKARGALVNVLDDVAWCDFAAMSQVVHGDLQLSVATNGRAPAVAKAVRQRLETAFGPEWGELVAIVDEAKVEIGPRQVGFDEWAQRWTAALEDAEGLVARIRRGDRAGVRDHLVSVVAGRSDPAARPDAAAGGRVHLVGAGPGDPDLLTVRAARLLATADLVVHDQLVPPSILELAAPGAEVVPVGRRLGHVVLAHEQVIGLLADAASRGRRVVRLKGGDPVVFGRGGEEALELAARGIATELVPGISSAVAAPELAGIPLTHRGVAAGFLVVTGRCATEDRVDWEQAASFRGTLVVLMGATRLGAICLELRRFGRSASTPAAIVENAGRPQQRVVSGNLGDLAQRALTAGIGTPAVAVIGDVVTLRERTLTSLEAARRPGGAHAGTAGCVVGSGAPADQR
jgi:uroporphyrin-III C-methyltransferase / precorrin-2 dehydrogenase / sirohydrochlorin ferrochelatase